MSSVRTGPFLVAGYAGGRRRRTHRSGVPKGPKPGKTKTASILAKTGSARWSDATFSMRWGEGQRKVISNPLPDVPSPPSRFRLCERKFPPADAAAVRPAGDKRDIAEL